MGKQHNRDMKTKRYIVGKIQFNHIDEAKAYADATSASVFDTMSWGKCVYDSPC